MQIASDDLTAVRSRLKRAQGQLAGVIAMIDDGRDCEDIVTQMAAVAKAIDRAAFLTISTGMRQCVIDPEGSAMDSAKLEKLLLSFA